MICNRIEITDFRNIASADVTFDPGVNLLWGDNAQGKTNLLEAICYTALGKSFRPVKDAEVIRFGADSATVVNHFSDSLREQTIRFSLTPGKARRVEQNGVKVVRMSDMVGSFRVVLFCPEHLSLIQGGGDLRRSFLNVALSQLRPLYLQSMQRYNKILKERNRLLKLAKEDMQTFRATEPMWSSQLAHEAAVIADHRDRYIALVNEAVRVSFADMTSEKEIPELTYVNSLKATGDALRDREAVEARYLELLSTRHDSEIAAGATLYGIHRDDIAVTLNGRPARLYASQGQQRSLALAMKLAEGELCRRLGGGEMPVFLFDDVLSELDAHRRAYLISRMEGRQVIMTACDPTARELARGNIRTIRVTDGAYSDAV